MTFARPVALLVFALLLASSAQAQDPGTCEPALAEAELSAGNVRARIFNNGALFWRGSPHVYEVPKGSGVQAIFASTFNIGGLVDGQLRVAASAYGPFEFWAGPLNDDGSPPTDCDRYDRIWSISKADLKVFDATGSPSPDLASWPTGLGAPTLDAEGGLIDLSALPLAVRAERTIDLAAGERPVITGDQMLWWVMNDQGNVHNRSDTPPIGLEVHASAFSFAKGGALGNTTFFRMKILKPHGPPLEEAYVGINQDADLGNFQDDYVGSDSVLGLAYTYNSDNDDEGKWGYGEAPPAVGLDFFRGPVADSDGQDNNLDGLVDEQGERQPMSAFVFYFGGAGVQGDPGSGANFYTLMQGQWRDGQSVTVGGNGRRFSSVPTSFMYSGMPPAFWSEFDSDGLGTAISPADRRWFASAGPFSVGPGRAQEILFGLVTSFGIDNLDSVRKLKEDDRFIQTLVDADFASVAPPDPPVLTATPRNRAVLLNWDNPPTSNNYREGFNADDPFLSHDVPDRSFRFEGYRILRFEGPDDPTGVVIATFDLDNGIRYAPTPDGPISIGTNSGLQFHLEVTGLVNYLEYDFGVQAFAYNSAAPLLVGEVSRVTTVPAPSSVEIPGEAFALADSALTNIRDRSGGLLAVPGGANAGGGQVLANITNPEHLTGLDYVFVFDQDASIATEDNDTGRGLVDGLGILEPLGVCAPQFDVRRSDGTTAFAWASQPPGVAIDGIFETRFDGLSVAVTPEFSDFTDFKTVAAPGATSSQLPWGAAADFRDFPGLGRPRTPDGRQQWLVHAGMPEEGADPSYSGFLDRTFRGPCNRAAPFDYEIRFTAGGSLNYDRFAKNGGGIQQPPVPFELWNVGDGTPEDQSDDYRMIPAVIDWKGDGWGLIPEDHPVSGSTNDPYTDWVYWYEPADRTPGEAGYEAWAENVLGGADPQELLGPEVMARMVFVSWNGGETNTQNPVFDDPDGPRQGITIRIETSRPTTPGDSFTLSTAGLEPTALSLDTRRDDLEQIGISPNPFRATSLYSKSAGHDEVRFTGLPERVDIRVFTTAGSLVKSFRKDGPSRWLSWDLNNEDGRPLAAGIYLISFETDLGPVVRKFGVLRARR